MLTGYRLSRSRRWRRRCSNIDVRTLACMGPGLQARPLDPLAVGHLLPPEGRRQFREAYGTIADDQLLCARILSLL